MKCNLKWTDVYSNEQGYVGKVSKKEGHFLILLTRLEPRHMCRKKLH